MEKRGTGKCRRERENGRENGRMTQSADHHTLGLANKGHVLNHPTSEHPLNLYLCKYRASICCILCDTITLHITDNISVK